MKINWTKLNKELDFENSLMIATVDCVNEFTTKNFTDETFYAFTYDLELEQGHFGLCLNTVQYLEKQLNKYTVNESTQNSKLFNDLKYGPGDWKYQSFNNHEGESSSNIWELTMNNKLDKIYEVLEEIEFNEHMGDDEIHEVYNALINDIHNSIENVVQRLANEKSFKNLNKTEDFKIYWIHIQENANEILHRIN